jgi:hypothetical protein
VSRHAKVSTAPMAIASDGAVLVNAAQLTTSGAIAAIVEVAQSTGLDVFVAVVVPERLRVRVLRDVDDAATDIVGRLGAKLTAVAASSASGRAAARERRGHRGRRAGGLRHPQRRPA